MTNPQSSITNAPLARDVGVFGATLMGLGSILGTGIFVSIGIAAGSTGPSVVLAVVVAAIVATCNGMSSAQLAAAHPVSGGTYEYGYRWLHPSLGFLAGWMFVLAKSASAATAALGFAGYALLMFGNVKGEWQIPLGLGTVVLLTLLVLTGLRRSTFVNVLLVSITVGSLVVFVAGGLPTMLRSSGDHLTPFFSPAGESASPLHGFLEACALMFVAYTGYGRIATLGEEIREPRKNIPRAIIVTLVVSLLLYVSVGLIAIGTLGAGELFQATLTQAAPLETAARRFGLPGIPTLVAIGAATAMLGVLLNLVLGLSRVVLAMGRRRDLPGLFEQVDASGKTPYAAVILVGGIIAGLVLVGDVKTTWSFSAFTVLIYYALTNLSAIRMQPEERLYPVSLAWLGLASCLFLAFWVEPKIWLIGLGLCAAGLVWWSVANALRGQR